MLTLFSTLIKSLPCAKGGGLQRNPEGLYSFTETFADQYLTRGGICYIISICVLQGGFKVVFSGFMFLCLFLPVVLILYNLSKSIAYKNVILVISSLFFYAWGEPVYVLLFMASILINYILGRIMDKFYAQRAGRAAFIGAVVINLAFLGVFKYAGFLISNVNWLFGLSFPNPNIALPIGISFYTFQILSYIIDVYNGKTRVQKSLIKFAAYVSMFPQLIAGPIVRYTDIARELDSRHTSIDDFADGIKKFTAGLCKKVIIANYAGSAASLLLDSPRFSAASAWLGIILYAFQIYFDFSSYSDMAIGLGRIFGFHFCKNFDYPYISKSVTDFWRRWHISLSSFFRDYVYIPLGGNRYKATRNLFAVWMLTGLWHGASWNFIAWGLFYGIMLFIEKNSFRHFLQKLPRPLCYIYTMFIVLIGWALFYYTDTASLIGWFKNAFGIGSSLYDLVTVTTLYSNLWLIIVCVAACTPLPRIVFVNLCRRHKKFALICEPLLVAAGLAACFILLAGQTYNPFLYFRF